MKLEVAQSLATRLHGTQLDKAGQPYVLHLERVAAAVEGDEAKTVAWLHDMLEDTPMTVEALQALGFSEAVVAAVVVLTRLEGEPYLQYIGRVIGSKDRLALTVKRADLQDHLRPGAEILSLSPRYRRALDLIGT